MLLVFIARLGKISGGAIFFARVRAIRTRLPCAKANIRLELSNVCFRFSDFDKIIDAGRLNYVILLCK